MSSRSHPASPSENVVPACGPGSPSGSLSPTTITSRSAGQSARTVSISVWCFGLMITSTAAESRSTCRASCSFTSGLTDTSVARSATTASQAIMNSARLSRMIATMSPGLMRSASAAAKLSTRVARSRLVTVSPSSKISSGRSGSRWQAPATSSMTVRSGAWLQGAPACECRTTAFNNRPFAQGALRQATSCSPAESGTVCRRGSVAWQPSSAIGHRGWNRQPGGIADASATSPPSSVT